MTHESLQKTFDVLKELGGYLVIRDETGEEFVISRRSDRAGLEESAQETDRQLSLAQAPVNNSADEVLERINEELALYQLQQAEQRFLVDEETAAESGEATYHAVEEVQAPVHQEEDTFRIAAPPIRIRFEPLRGDLSPDLQE